MKPCAILIMSVGTAVLLACAGTQSSGTGNKTDSTQITPQRIGDIAGIEWHLKSIKMDNKSITLIKDTQITFSCDGKGKAAGVASINRYFGSFRLREDGEIAWSKAFGMTRMAGPPELMAQETKFMQALPLTTRIYLKNEKLQLISTDQSTRLEFEKY